MGCGASSPELAEQTAQSKQIEKVMREDFKEEKEKIKLLLLGSGSSGKSTFAKQMRLLFMDGFADKEARVYASVIQLNILKNMKALVHAADRFALALQEGNEAAANELRQSTIHFSEAELTKERSIAIGKLWKDPAIQKAAERCSEFQFEDSAPYFFDNLDRISEENYKPSNSDILNLRVRTIGIVETKFMYKNRRFLMVDVGGQRNERKKWIHSFQEVTAILFVLGTSDYDLLLEEDMLTNRMHDALKLFGDVVNNKWFDSVNVVVFLNKKDLFAAKIAKTSLKVAFPDFPGPNTYEVAMKYIGDQIRAIDKSPAGTREIFLYETCATDTKAVEAVFTAVTSTLLTQALEVGGFD